MQFSRLIICILLLILIKCVKTLSCDSLSLNKSYVFQKQFKSVVQLMNTPMIYYIYSLYPPAPSNQLTYYPHPRPPSESTIQQQILTKSTFNEQSIPQNDVSSEMSIEQDQKQEKLSKQIKSIKTRSIKEENENQYRPYARNSKKKIIKLKENRNVLPIKIRQILSFMSRETKSSLFTKKIFAQENLKEDFTEKRFYTFLKMRKLKLNNYLREDSLRELLTTVDLVDAVYSCQEQQFYNKVMRIMALHYLHNFATFTTLNSNRIHSCKKIEHLRVQRELMNFVRGKPMKEM